MSSTQTWIFIILLMIVVHASDYCIRQDIHENRERIERLEVK